MDDLIDRNRLLKEIREVYEYEFPTASGDFDRFVKNILPNIICNQPAADAKPVVHGHWTDGRLVYTCSVCGMGSVNDYRYCPHCGATMDEKGR